MNIDQLSALVPDNTDPLVVSLSALESEDIIANIAPFLPEQSGALIVGGITSYSKTADSITVSGTGGNQVFLGMSISAVFSLLPPDGTVELQISAQGPSDWTLAQSFPVLQQSPLTQVFYNPSPEMTLSSTPGDEGAEGVMLFDAVVADRSPLMLLAFLYGGLTQQLSGQITMFNGMPNMVINAPINPSTQLGFFTLVNVGYQLYSDPLYNSGYFTWDANGYIGYTAAIPFSAQGKQHSLTMMANVYDPYSNIVFVMQLADAAAAAMDEIEALLNDIGLSIPGDQYEITDNVLLSDLQLNVNLGSADKLTAIALKVETSNEWVLIEDLLTLQAIDVSFRIDRPVSQPSVSGSISGLFGIGETGTLQLSAIFDSGTGSFAFGGGLRGDDPLSMPEVFSHFMKTEPIGIPNLSVTVFDFYVEVTSGFYWGQIELVGEWAIPLRGSTDLVLQEVSFGLNHMQPGAVLLHSQVVFGIAGVQFFVKADYDGPESGWTFEGGTGPGQSIPIGALIADMVTLFGDFVVPSTLANLTIGNLDARFNTLHSEFFFTCDIMFPVGDSSVDMALLISRSFDRDKQGFSITFGGTLTIDTLVFDLHFVDGVDSDIFVATYNHTPDQPPLNVHDLVASISSSVAGFIPANLTIELKDVLFAYYAKGATTEYIFGLDIGAHINLSDLPLVGRQFPPEQTLGVDDLQIVISSDLPQTAIIQQYNALMPRGVTRLPAQGLGEGLNIAAIMQFGATSETLSMPVIGNSLPPPPSTPPPGSQQAASADNALWYNVQKSFGPVHFERVGVQYKDEAIFILLDAALSAAGLTLSLDGLGVGTTISSFSPRFTLSGLGVDYSKPPVEIGGALLRVTRTEGDVTYDEYDGMAVIKTAGLGISAIGSYAYLNDYPSLFVYGVLDAPLGGPAFFFVTGLSAGFGYNRALNIPPLEQLTQFPLVAEAIAGIRQPGDIDAELRQLHTYIPPSSGEYFLAVGVKFTSFKLIDAFALLSASFGASFELNLLGLATLVVPTPVAGQIITPLAEAQLALRATFAPSRGFLGVSAQLTNNSFIFSRDCHLTGGFAFSSWFSGEHAGEFVLTLGGYHPGFSLPDYYPRVPPLGFNWQLDQALALKGSLYYALTGSALMAGGSLQATWKSGDLKAWFSAQADFLLAWQPYHYDLKLSLSIGVSYTFSLFGTHTLNVDVGADLHLWGPDFSGHAHLKLSIISFDIDFGAAALREPAPLTWDEFKSAFLPDDGEICSISVQSGLVDTPKNRPGDQQGEPIDWVINPTSFALVTNALIPAGQGLAGRVEIPLGPEIQTSFGVAPMNLSSSHVGAQQAITITRDGAPAEEEFELVPIAKSVPAGMWGQQIKPDLRGPTFLERRLAGFAIRPKQQPAEGASATLAKQLLQHEAETIGAAFQWQQQLGYYPQALDDAQRRAAISQSLEQTRQAREDMLQMLGITTTVDIQPTIVDDFLIAPQIGTDAIPPITITMI